jgi:hypothetical protein
MLVDSYYFNPVSAKRMPYFLTGTKVRLFPKYDSYILNGYVPSIVSYKLQDNELCACSKPFKDIYRRGTANAFVGLIDLVACNYTGGCSLTDESLMISL